jgi:transposase InsO family protein
MKNGRRTRHTDNRDPHRRTVAQGARRARRIKRDGPSDLQMDWTPMSIIVARDADGSVVRPTLALVLDAHTRAVIGWHVS